MRISNVVINNYKSIGSKKNNLSLENDVTALIGKNDSGKSNVIEILGAISFSHYILDDFFKFNNGCEECELSLVVELRFNYKEIKLLKDYKDIEVDRSFFYFKKNEEIEFKGGFSRLFIEDIELMKSVSYLNQELIRYLEDNYYSSMDKKFICQMKRDMKYLENIHKVIWTKYKKTLNKLLYILNSYDDDDYFINQEYLSAEEFDYSPQNIIYDEKRYTLIRHVEIIKSKIRKKYSLLPII